MEAETHISLGLGNILQVAQQRRDMNLLDDSCAFHLGVLLAHFLFEIQWFSAQWLGGWSQFGVDIGLIILAIDGTRADDAQLRVICQQRVSASRR